jgi:hypothetical protein
MVPIVPIFPQPPPPPQQQHHNYGQIVASGLTGAALGFAVDHHHHQHDQENPPPPPPPQQQHHYGQLVAAGLTGAAIGLAVDHHHHQHDQENPPPPPPPQHHYGQLVAEGLGGAAIGLAAEHMVHHHQHDQQNPPPANLPPPPVNNAPVLVPVGPIQPPMVGPDPHHGGGAVAAAVGAGALGLAMGAEIEAHHNRLSPPPQPQIPPPPPPVVVQQVDQAPILLEASVTVEETMQVNQPPAPIIIPALPVLQDPFQDLPPNQGGAGGQPMPPPLQMPVPPVGMGQPVQIRPQPVSGGVQDNLHENFPYGPGPNMVTNSLDTLFVQEQQQRR